MLISVVIPCFNNEDSIDSLMTRLLAVIAHVEMFDFEIVFVDDGSKDGTYQKHRSHQLANPGLIKTVKLTRNFGSYNSFLAGLGHASGDITVYLHADLQDPPELIPEMLTHFNSGYPLVIANRIDRADTSVFSTLYHKLVQRFGIRDIPPGGFDLIMFNRTIREELLSIGEKNTNNVYLIAWLGHPYIAIPYRREKRQHGESQWKFFSKVKLFLDTLFSFTKLPLLVIRLLFFGAWALSLCFIVGLLLHQQFIENLVMVSFSLAFSLLTTGLMIIGEYLDRIHESVRNRPNFVVEKFISE